MTLSSPLLLPPSPASPAQMRLLVIEASPDGLVDLASGLQPMARSLMTSNAAQLQDVEIALFAPHIILLEVRPDDGLEMPLARRIRRLWPGAGLILVTERAQLEQRLQGYALGADHCLARPLPEVELAAVTAALMRRLSMQASPCGDCWVLDPRHQQLIAPDGKTVELSRAECQVVACMQQAPERTASRRCLAERLGENWLTYDERRLEAIFSRLRRKILSFTGLPAPIRALRNQGYAFTAALLLRL